jgi:hypothetical protein
MSSGVNGFCARRLAVELAFLRMTVDGPSPKIFHGRVA